MLKRILYISSSLIDPESSQMVELARKSAHSNSLMAVTGFLYYDRKAFLQVIEGMSEDVDALYTRICEDPRHNDVRTLRDEGIERRLFGNWTMGMHDGATAGGEGLASQVLGERFPDRIEPGDAQELIAFLSDISVGRSNVLAATGTGR